LGFHVAKSIYGKNNNPKPKRKNSARERGGEDMKKKDSKSLRGKSPSQLIDARIKELGD
jgi:hypothetical protein